MKKILFLLLIIANLFSSSVYGQSRLEHPPIPEESPAEEKVAIVTLPTKLTQSEIQRLLEPYPDVKLRYIFEHALTGFSIKGSNESIRELSKSNQVATISPVNTYKVEKVEENIRIIGGETVRGYFDLKDHRLTGKGIKVGVIDTGIDYTHPDLRRSYGGGRDLVDSDDDPMETKSYIGQNTLHGTHVAGVIAANGRITGVAPDAKIIAYRALGPGGTGTTEQVIAAIDAAIKDKVDILNLSLGNTINGPDLPISLALNKAVDSGIVAVTSSGNSGPNMWTVGSPGTASKAISVGASTPPLKIPYVNIDGVEEAIRLEPMQGAILWDLDRSYQIAFGGLGKKEELKNVKGKVALIERGEITFTEKAMNAHEAGAKAVIIYNNTKGSFIGNLEGKVDIPVATVSKNIGLSIKKLIKNSTPYVRTHLIEEKDLMADFSSRGPVTSTWEIKPDVVAPGVAINSTIPGGYLALQGTSMAAPHVAGACALIKQAHPDWGPDEIKASIMNTAKPIRDEKGNPYSTYVQGAGRIQVDAAINTNTLVSPASLQFGKFKISDQQHEHTQYITIRNVGERAEKYSISVPKSAKGIKWEVPLSFTVGPNEKKKIAINMSVDPSVFNKKIQDGHLELQAGSQSISIPYLYVLEEPNYPRVMGFDFGLGDQKGTYRYEVYLPGGAEEFGIALFDPDNFRFIGFLDWKRNVSKGMVKEEVKPENLPMPGVYLAKVFAIKAGQEDTIETAIMIINR
ncbi:S8 family serine peptidase [Cytobacillus sp. FJAT-54145]|uniref:S8 family serine peptidase n=1 Tax=Cytobacillus spartinae TaxID=3299023 RepID=A0ABW6KG46_9BACI